MYSFFIGCDMSKSFFDVSYHDGNKPMYLDQFTNDANGFKLLVKALKGITNCPKAKWFVCFENTGVYSKLLLEYLISHSIACKEENALQIVKSLGLRRGKDDKVDSKRICLYAFEKRDSIKPTSMPDKRITKLKKLLSRRNLLIRNKVSFSNSMSEQKAVLEPGLYKMLTRQNQELLNLIKKQIKEIEKEICATINEDEQIKKNYELVQTVAGVGPIISAQMIATTENFTCFSSARKFACFAGIAPFPNRSGNFEGKTKVSHYADKKVKALISNGVNAAVRWDKEMGEYYERKLKERKAKGCVKNAIKNKIIHRIFAVVKRQTPYVKMINYV